MLVAIHLAVAILAAICGGLLALVMVAGAFGHRDVRFAIDRAILVALGAVAIGILIGLVMLATGARPADPLHFLYAAVALVLLPIVRFWDRLAGHQAIAVGIGGIVLVALVLRLFQTG